MFAHQCTPSLWTSGASCHPPRSRLTLRSRPKSGLASRQQANARGHPDLLLAPYSRHAPFARSRELLVFPQSWLKLRSVLRKQSARAHTRLWTVPSKNSEDGRRFRLNFNRGERSVNKGRHRLHPHHAGTSAKGPWCPAFLSKPNAILEGDNDGAGDGAPPIRGIVTINVWGRKSLTWPVRCPGRAVS